MDKVLVTGGSGFVGLALVRRLRKDGISVVAAARNYSAEVEKCGAVMRCGDVRDRNFLIQAAQGCDTIFHTAAKAGIWGSRQDYYSINVHGTDNVLAACRANKTAGLIYTSTPSVVFEQREIDGGDESLPYSSEYLCHYAETKAIAEKKILAANSDGLKTTALRPHLIWGPGDTNLIPRLLARGRNGTLKQVGEGDNKVDISYIDNVVDAQVLAAKNLHGDGRAAGKPYFISQGKPVNLWNWINTLFERLHIPKVAQQISYKKAYLGGAMLEAVYTICRIKKEPLMTRFLAEQLAKSHWFSIRRAQDDFAYKAEVSTEEGVDRLIKWIQQR
jgi:nucleoside-diphosphate-sugar epimerase